MEAGKARHLAYDHDKLMIATRQFAAEHGISLPKGYYNDKPGHQLSLYEKVQEDQTGLSLEERKAVVTDRAARVARPRDRAHEGTAGTDQQTTMRICRR